MKAIASTFSMSILLLMIGLDVSAMKKDTLFLERNTIPENEKTYDNQRSADSGETAVFYYHSNQVGSTTHITDGSGEVYQHLEYFPFGETFVEEQSSDTLHEELPYQFSGKEKDEETGMYYYGARHYDPIACGWLSVDPLADDDPGWSAYNGFRNNPIIYLDPDGRRWTMAIKRRPDGSPFVHINYKAAIFNPSGRAIVNEERYIEFLKWGVEALFNRKNEQPAVSVTADFRKINNLSELGADESLIHFASPLHPDLRRFNTSVNGTVFQGGSYIVINGDLYGTERGILTVGHEIGHSGGLPHSDYLGDSKDANGYPVSTEYLPTCYGRFTFMEAILPGDPSTYRFGVFLTPNEDPVLQRIQGMTDIRATNCQLQQIISNIQQKRNINIRSDLPSRIDSP